MKKQLQRNIEFLDKGKENLLEFGERLKFIRITLRHTQAEFAKKLGRNSSTITAYETGVIKHPKDEFFETCAQVFNVNADYLKDGSSPMFFKEPAQLVQVELIDKTQNAMPSVKESSTSKVIQKSSKTNTDANLTPKEFSTENESVEVQILPKGDDETCKNDFTKDEFTNTHQTFTHIETDENGKSVICPVKEPLNSKQLNELTKQGKVVDINHSLPPLKQPASYNFFVFKDIELDLMVYESKIYISAANVSRIVKLHLMNDVLLYQRTFSQAELKKATFRTFQELGSYNKDELYIECKGLMTCYKGHKNKDIVEFMTQLKDIVSDLQQRFTTHFKLDGECGVVLFENFELGKIRVKGDSENPLFCLSDVCKILEIQDTYKVKQAILGEFELSTLNVGSFKTNFGVKEFTMITEPQLYFVLMRSDKPKAKPFRQWVINEVLPQIRKQGRYEFQPNVPQQTQLTCEKSKDKALDLALIQARNQIKLIEENKALSLENARYKALFKREGEFSLRETAKLFGINTFELKSFLIKENLITHYPNKDKQYPTQYAKDNGFVKMKLTDTKRVSYDIYLTMPLIERLKEFFGEIDL